MDILCHALESYTARPYASYEQEAARPAGALLRLQPDLRHVVGEGDVACSPGRSGAPCTTATTARPATRWRWPRPSPVWASATPACTSRTRTPTRSRAGSGTSDPEGYPGDEPMVPHGMAVSLTAPEAFRWTFEAAPERHLRAAELLDPDHGHDGPGRPARRADRPDARHRHPQRPRRRGLRRGRRRRPGRGHHEAAAAARHGPARGRPRTTPPGSCTRSLELW